jgi:hypothetical protein
MNRAFFPVMKSLGIAVLAVSSMIPAAYANTDAKAVKADPAKGEACTKLVMQHAASLPACPATVMRQFHDFGQSFVCPARIWLNS